MHILDRLRSLVNEVMHKLIPYKQIEQAGHFESPVSEKMAAAHTLWAQMYQNQAPWLADDGMRSLNLAAFICSELARQVVMELKWNITGTQKDAGDAPQNNPRASYLSDEFSRCMGITLREKLQQGMASGGMVIRPYPVGGRLFFDFSPDWCVYPAAFNGSGDLTDVIFRDQHTDGKTIYTRLERQTVSGDDVVITQRCFRSQTPGTLGTECPLTAVPLWAELAPELTVHNTGGRPLFGRYRVASANTEDLDTVLGSSVFAAAADCIRDADEQYSRLIWEFKAKETAIDVDPTALLPVGNGARAELPKLERRLFRALDLGHEDTYHVYDPPIRDVSILNGLNSIFCRIEDLCGIARGTVSDPNEQAMTATQIKMMKQRTYETISVNQQALESCLRDVIRAMDIYASALGLAPPGEYDASFEWDDSVIVDTDQQLNERLSLVNAGAMSKAELRMWYLGETQAQAEAAVQRIAAEQTESMLPDDFPTGDM